VTGWREQARFKLVFQKATFSNNNVWMRRKLMEAAGVVPIKSPRRRHGDSKSRPQGIAGLPPITIGEPQAARSHSDDSRCRGSSSYTSRRVVE
jgi:hypothetical protein